MFSAVRLFTIPLLLSILLLAQAGDPWLGTWRLNLEKSAVTNSVYKRVTMRIEPRGEGLSVVYDMVGTRGGVTHVEWNGKLDGRDYPVQGVDYFATNAYTRVDNNAYNIATKRDGQLANTIKVTVSADGKTLTAVTTGRTAQGQESSTTTVYDKL
jgi:hypothetical protein